MTDVDMMRFVTGEAMWEASPDGLVLVDANGIIREVNDPLLELFATTRDAVLGEPVECLIPEHARSAHVGHRNGFLATPGSRPMGAAAHLEGLRADGTRFPVNVSLFTLTTERGPMVVAAVRDLTGWTVAQAELETSRRLRAVAEDHDRIARELHDTVIQRLFVVGLGLQSLSTQIEGEENSSRMLDAVEAIDETIREIRTTIFGLQEPARQHQSLRLEVLDVVNEMEAGLGFAPDVRFAGPVDDIETTAVVPHVRAVVREALSNAARHAAATEVLVRVAVGGDGPDLVIDVTDNGIGIPPLEARSGLRNLEDRALQLEGTFQVERRSSGGTALRWAVPVV